MKMERKKFNSENAQKVKMKTNTYKLWSLKKIYLLFALAVLFVFSPAPAESAPLPGLTNVLIYVDHFLGSGKSALVGDVTSMKRDALKFSINGNEFDYSGHYSILVPTPRKHKAPYFGFGSTETAKFLTLEDFFKDQSDSNMVLPNATIWEKSDGYVVAEAAGKEWIHSGNYTITN
jgi:hypothetical protein